MRNILYLLLLLLLPFRSAAQQPTVKETVSFNNQFEVGIEILATSFSYTRKVNNNIRIGVGLGLGFGLGFGSYFVNDIGQPSFTFQEGILEFGHIEAVIEFKINRKLYYEFKLQSAAIDKGGLSSSSGANGFANGIFIRMKRVKIGANVFVGQEDSGKWLFYIKPLQLKIRLTK